MEFPHLSIAVYLVYSVCLVCLVWISAFIHHSSFIILVYLVCLVCLVWVAASSNFGILAFRIPIHHFPPISAFPITHDLSPGPGDEKNLFHPQIMQIDADGKEKDVFRSNLQPSSSRPLGLRGSNSP
jgi:hypothetical protein